MRILFLAFAILMMTASCRYEADREAAVPKPYAYPRFSAYPDSSIMAEVGGISFLVNACAATETDGRWMNIAYPAYGGTIMLSVTENESERELAEAIANRHERIALNLGGRSARSDRFVNDDGFECEMVVSKEASSTPVQFIATGPGRTMVSGAAVLSASGSVDSVAPIVDAIERDVFKLLKSIKK